LRLLARAVFTEEYAASHVARQDEKTSHKAVHNGALKRDRAAKAQGGRFAGANAAIGPSESPIHNAVTTMHQESGGLRVIFLATSSGEGGIERHSVLLATCLSERGIDVTYICSPGSFVERHSQSKGLKTESLVSRNSADPKAIYQLASWIDELNADIVHVHSRRDFVPAVLAVHLARCRRRQGRSPRLIIHSHLDKPLGSPPGLSRRLFTSAADIVIAVSQAVKKRLLDEHKLAPSFVRLLYNGIDPDLFFAAGTKTALDRRYMVRFEWDVPKDAIVIGMVGRLDAKGQKELLMGASGLLRQKKNIWVVMVGPEGEPGDMDNLRQLAVAEGISSQVIMTGAKDDIPGILPAFDLLAHLPRNESFGLALVEAMASGIPAITTNVGGCNEIVVHNQTGIVVDPDKPSELTGALTRLIMDDNASDIRGAFGEAGRKRALNSFSLDNQVRQLCAWYNQIVKHRPHTRMVE
jgi:glycosyltransferase involved in cell wall biosynthesis